MEDAVKLASEEAIPGDIVLLSPAAASFDQYQNFEKRGEHFIELVKKIL
jgi:UDP-N-acetylmuramoylalanine--D-glutamate ligase